MIMHQLRLAPDYADALSTPLPMHLASLAQAYVLPTTAEEDDEAEEEGIDAGHGTISDADLASALGLDAGSCSEDEADLDPEHPDMPGLAQTLDEPDALLADMQRV